MKGPPWNLACDLPPKEFEILAELGGPEQLQDTGEDVKV